MVVTPGDILSRCRALDARITAATRAIESAPKAAIDAEFRSAWDARARRWQELRGQCAEWASRWWNWKWEPRLDDWFNNQAVWEQEIEKRTGRALPVPKQATPDEAPKLPDAPNLREATNKLALGVGIVAALGVSLAIWNMRSKKA